MFSSFQLRVIVASVTFSLLHCNSSFAQEKRLSINEFVKDPAKVAAFEKAIAEMRKRDIQSPNDPTGWLYQAAVHGKDVSDNDQPKNLWNQCKHNSWWFLPWHRAYIFQFEKMLQKYSGDNKLRLPYWDYSDPNQRVLPAIFRKQTSPLYEKNRATGINTGAALPDEIVDHECMNSTVFITNANTVGFGGPKVTNTDQFSGLDDEPGSVEFAPHDLVHGALGGRWKQGADGIWRGGFMSNPQTAAQDPIFWLHHSNIDRLWEAWRSLHPNTSLPSESAWSDQKFDLFDPNGQVVSMKIADLLDTTRLGYTYDNLNVSGIKVASDTEIQPLSASNTKTISLAQSNNSVSTMTSKPQVISLKVSSLPEAQHILDPTVSFPMSGRKKILLLLKDIKLHGPVGTTYDVYLNNKSANYLSGTDKTTFVGALGFFNHPGGHSHNVNRSFDITRLVDTQKTAGKFDPKQIQVTLVPIGLMVKGKRTKPKQIDNITITSIEIQGLLQQSSTAPEI